jgi:hypothetical protein
VLPKKEHILWCDDERDCTVKACTAGKSACCCCSELVLLVQDSHHAARQPQAQIDRHNVVMEDDVCCRFLLILSSQSDASDAICDHMHSSSKQLLLLSSCSASVNNQLKTTHAHLPRRRHNEISQDDKGWNGCVCCSSSMTAAEREISSTAFHLSPRNSKS